MIMIIINNNNNHNDHHLNQVIEFRTLEIWMMADAGVESKIPVWGSVPWKVPP